MPQWPFQHYFPDGKGDPTNQSNLRDIPLQERIKHLLKFAECIDDKWVYRFASHPRFLYWAFNMIQRKRILQQSEIFLKQNPGEAHLNIDMNYGKWLTVTTPIYFCPKYLDMSGILLVLMHIGIE